MVRALDEAKRITILQAARRILLRDGYAEAKMADIAAEAGVAPGTLYLYFESKEALASAIAEESYSRFSSQFVRVIKKLDMPEGVDALLDWAMRIAVEERDVLAMAKQSKPDEKSRQAKQRFVDQLAEVLADVAAKGHIRKYDDIASLANVVLAVVHRVVMSCAIHEDASPEQVKNTAVIVLRHALFDDATLSSHPALTAAAGRSRSPRLRRV